MDLGLNNKNVLFNNNTILIILYIYRIFSVSCLEFYGEKESTEFFIKGRNNLLYNSLESICISYNVYSN